MRRNIKVILAIVITSMLVNSCLDSFDCNYDVYENEDFFVRANIDDEQKFTRDTSSNLVIPGMHYLLDTADLDSIILYFDTYFLLDGTKEIIVISLAVEDEIESVVNMGNNNLNYLSFDSIVKTGSYDYTARMEDDYKYGADIAYLVNDTIRFFMDASAENPDDFSFVIDSYERNQQDDCYNRIFNWYTINGTFSCRLVSDQVQDTIKITNGEFRSAISQYYFGTL